MTGEEFLALLKRRFPVRLDTEHEEPYWWDLLRETADYEFNRAYEALHKKGPSTEADRIQAAVADELQRRKDPVEEENKAPGGQQ
jgi:hypothetical protein